MTIESIPPTNKILQADLVKINDKNLKPMTKSATSTENLDTDVKQTIDEVTGLLQSIVTTKISDKVLRKLPSDEYLHLLSLLDEIVHGSVNKRV
jgi:uncharacterized FlaG/YvyC family protein